ncbi:ABC transporter permease [Amycolatopsis taiwanensis]|uniref:ABC-2 type transporter transmembrane domain-containing protein n=1 Tax=Amycolatopsis taiwanensis TaxID=342230 RepID=A0A9W6R3Y2_9PSEU|nr:ABC transporter permease [Amycolatopsis taiwanensis]GLY67202.1 hypothetical protein Atai01_38210 [Amycolatopsis taiwanensis]
MLGVLVMQQAVVLAAGLVLGVRVAHPALLILTLMAWTLVLLGLGATLGAFANSHSALSAGYDIGGLVLSALGGALVPIAAMPGWLAAVAPVSPGYWAVSGLHAALDGNVSRALAAAAVLVAFAVAAGLVAAWRIRRGWGRSTKL